MPGFNTPFNPVNPIVRPILAQNYDAARLTLQVEFPVISTVTTIVTGEVSINPTGYWGPYDTE
jgi:hypothetical protein